MPVPKSKIDIRPKKPKMEDLAHCYKLINELSKREIRFTLRSKNNKSCISSIKAFELHCNQLVPTECVNMNYRETYRLYMNRKKF